MRIAGLKNLQLHSNINASQEISLFMKKTLPAEINSIRYSFRSLFETIEIQKMKINQDTLKNLGIAEIGKTPADGIRLFGDNYNHIIYLPDKNTLKLVYLNKINGDAEKIVTINNGNIFRQSKVKNESEFEDELEDVLSLIDHKLSKLKTNCTPNISRPYIPASSEQKHLDDVNRLLRTPNHFATLKGVRLGSQELNITESITIKYDLIKDLYRKFNNNVTRYNVRNYYKNYDSKNSTYNIMAFKGIGPNGENIGVGKYAYNGKNYLMIKVMPDNKTPYAFVISEDGTVQKNLPYETVRTQFAKKRHDSVPDYYTQSELDKSNIKEYLECVDKELEIFRAHNQKCLDRQADFIATYNNDNMGSLAEQMPKINGIFNLIEKLKKGIRVHFEYITDSYPYLKDNNIDIEFSRRGIRLGKVTPEGYDLRITFPSVLKQRANQILVMAGDEVKKSFYIIDDKLLKLDIRDIHDAFTHAKRQRYYHSQEYIDNSNLDKYIYLITKILKRAENYIKISPSLEENMNKKYRN